MIPADRDLIIADYASVSPWAYSDMIVYSRAGLLVGADGCMTRDRRIISCPREAITRAEADAVLAWIHRYLTGQVDTPRHQIMNCDLAAATETIEVQSEEKSASPEDGSVTAQTDEEPVSPEQNGDPAAAADDGLVAEDREGSKEPEVSGQEPPSSDRAFHVHFETQELQCAGSVFVMHRLNRCLAFGIFPDQGSKRRHTGVGSLSLL